MNNYGANQNNPKDVGQEFNGLMSSFGRFFGALGNKISDKTKEINES